MAALGAEAGRMHVAPQPLLCELHAHSTWSDGALDIPALVDLYGSAGFDVLAVTDHVLLPQLGESRSISDSNYGAYLEQLEAEAERAAALYRLLLIPGLELTDDSIDARRGAHALALGIRSFVGLVDGLDDALATARNEGAALVAAHPYTLAASAGAARTTARFAEEPDWAAETVDRFEICNRHDFFEWVARARLPVVASGDFHRVEHLATWKTLVPAEKSEPAVVDYLRSRGPVSLTLIEPTRARLADAA
jgi:predicted metal-dependent phosphoesterase TrpH